MVSYAQIFLILTILAGVVILKVNDAVPTLSRSPTAHVEYTEAIHGIEGNPCPICEVGRLQRKIVNFGTKKFSVTMKCVNGCGEDSYWELEGDMWVFKAPYSVRETQIPTISLLKHVEPLITQKENDLITPNAETGMIELKNIEKEKAREMILSYIDSNYGALTSNIIFDLGLSIDLVREILDELQDDQLIDPVDATPSLEINPVDPENPKIECLVCHNLVDTTLDTCPICGINLDLIQIRGNSS